jgi:hypothetical protein
MIWNVPLGIHQKIARDENNPLIGPATGSLGQLGLGGIRDINANNGKIAASEFKNIRATAATDRLRPVGVRVGAKPAKKHGLHIHVECDNQGNARKRQE